MSGDQRDRSSSDEDSDGESGGRPMVGFLFGNVDSRMQLQDDYLDEVCFRHSDYHHAASHEGCASSQCVL